MQHFRDLNNLPEINFKSKQRPVLEELANYVDRMKQDLFDDKWSQATKKQWHHANGVGWDAPVAMAHMLREVYLMEDGTFEPSYMPNVTLKLEEGDVAKESEAQTAFNQYVK